jgi:hypothetical protein
VPRRAGFMGGDGGVHGVIYLCQSDQTSEFQVQISWLLGKGRENSPLNPTIPTIAPFGLANTHCLLGVVLGGSGHSRALLRALRFLGALDNIAARSRMRPSWAE